MSIHHSSKQNLNLSAVRTWLVDENPTSTFFRLSQIPEILTAGKNAFLIQGSPTLVKSTEVLVEITDINGDVVFSKPIRNYDENGSRVVSIEVYETTPAGPGIITILGHVVSDANGNLPPEEFVDAYNVKWQKPILISPRQPNDTSIRLLNKPILEVSEILSPMIRTTQISYTVTGTVDNTISGFSLRPNVEVNIDKQNPYILLSSTPIFVVGMISGTFSVTMDGLIYSSSISKIINNTTAELSSSLGQSDDSYLVFNTGSYQIDYTASVIDGSNEFIRSYANIGISNLSTFSGDVYRMKIYMTSDETPGEPQFLGDFRVRPAELLTTASILSGVQKRNIGNIIDQSTLDNFWVVGTIDSMSLYNPL